MNHVVVVGAGLAGVRTVEALRGRGFTGRITLIGQERHRPYDRPPLSKAVLKGEADTSFVDTDLETLGVEFWPGVGAKSLRAGVVETTEGEVAYDGLVIATGADPIRLPGDGPQHVLRTLDDAHELRAMLVPGARVAIIGAGWIGAEVATAARRAGCEVTVVESASAPLSTAVGAELGGRTLSWYDGIDLRLGTMVDSVDEGGVRLVGGEFVEAHVVVTGIGVRPAVEWLADADIDLHNGVVTDEHLRTSLPGVVAVGDCAAWWSRRWRTRLRVEHWDTALNAPEVAAATLLGEEAVYDPVPYFWSEQFGHMLQYAGHHPAGDRLVHRGEPEGKWSAVWLAGDGTLAAVLAVDRPRDLVQGRRIIDAGSRLDPERLVDPQVPLRDCVV
ncbi:3-phenylpropionate/trans-cinnamate dioxygenase ferredoxin reductase subunit [Nonomuraea thailandensis]|uniref:3-phenylpropionate/trans-cinnamate dioxygenase ferredoxin reductase subunit n=1 Tax=Nonomuraea thailandensis TaxID=1188745 RepID=A0A9X2GKQ3_9ACTN|nr:FAD-dependent oxidoreductase [Nonomuraea thailandensis]MCP2359555.1 3-phenylpropionate/trans-cinnamate dioxygenase ferredoxin reductase subunit [Nonomuraea thailandensis]